MFRRSRTVVAAETVVTGSLECGGDDGRIDGRLKGSIRSSATVTISEGGHVDGDVTANVVVVGGVIEGVVIAQERLHMLSTGYILGDATYGTLQVDRGGVVKGHTMTLSGAPPEEAPASLADQTLQFGVPSLEPVHGDRITADYTSPFSAVQSAGDSVPVEEEGEQDEQDEQDEEARRSSSS